MTTSLAVEGLDAIVSAASGAAPSAERLPRRWHDAAVATRAALGLPTPTDRPLLATGHQATLWHPGILAKPLLLDRLCARSGAASLRLLVDQDRHPIGPIEYPTIGASHAEGDLGIGRVVFAELDAAAPTGRRRPLRAGHAVATAPPDAALPSASLGVEAIVAAIARHATAPSVARQVDAALADLAAPWLHAIPVVAATDLLATPIGEAVLDAIASDPLACAVAFNTALRIMPRAARPLAISQDSVEVPLWRLPGLGAPRERMLLERSLAPEARRERLRIEATATPSRLAPRGLLLTALLRVLCDGFIHGRGGWRYDRVSEAWFLAWLAIDLAPMAMVTADLRLPLPVAVPTPGAAPIGERRRAWHDPFEDRDGAPTATKRRLLDRIAALPRRSPARRAAFAALQGALADARSARSLADPALLPRDPAAAEIAARRDWAFPLYPPAMLEALAREIDETIDAAIGQSPG